MITIRLSYQKFSLFLQIVNFWTNMKTRHRRLYLTFLLLSLLTFNSIRGEIDYEEFARAQKHKGQLPTKASDSDPYISFRVHKNGRFWTTVYNNGIIGNYFGLQDPDLQLTAPDNYYPRYSRIRHALHTSLWVGGVIGTDTLVSTTLDLSDFYRWWMPYYSEFWPDIYPFGEFRDFEPGEGRLENDLSKSETRYEAIFTDTFKYEPFIPYNPYDNRYHKPLNIQVTQTSYSWSYKYAEDFLIIDYNIKNIGRQDIKSAYVGLYHVGSNHYTGELPSPQLDDIPGYIDSIPYEFEELGYEKINMSWVIDHDGYPMGNTWYPISTRNALGIAPLGLNDDITVRNFNWWSNNYSRSWGPRRIGTPDDPLRLYGGDYGQPLSDKDKYHMMSHPEVDYNGYYAGRSMEYLGWMPEFEYGEDLIDGFFVFYNVSYGPYDIPVGQSINVTIFYGVGENVHQQPQAYRNEFLPDYPERYMKYLDFSDLTDNFRWAKRIYDNPGVDTDHDGDSGKYFFIVDTLTNDSVQLFYEGDGVPDFRGATPPPPPEIRVRTEEGKIIIRWNGEDIENYYDTFSLIKDFEGYRVYLARSIDEGDISLVASYDQENYSRYKWNKKLGVYELKETPFTKDQLTVMYGAGFNPLDYNRNEPFTDSEGDYYYFAMVDYNSSNLFDPNSIHKVYPDAELDTADVDEFGRMRYYEYEFTIDDLLPSVPYYVVVTAFDFGHPAKSLPSLESSKTDHLVKAFALKQGEDVLEGGELNVVCYPNPYRIDDDYTAGGFENRFSDQYVERARTIYFANLPYKCTISIYSLDGDLVRRLEHNESYESGEGSIARFDMINRNDQSIVTGIYYWVVESEFGNQVGKLVVIK